MDNNWIKELKVGDEVIAESTGWGTNWRRVWKVEKINKETIRVSGRLFGIESGRQYKADEWHPVYLHPCTEQAKEEIRLECEKSKLVAYLAVFNWGTLDNEKLREIYNMIKEGDK